MLPDQPRGPFPAAVVRRATATTTPQSLEPPVYRIAATLIMVCTLSGCASTNAPTSSHAAASRGTPAPQPAHSAAATPATPAAPHATGSTPMRLGNFSVSLAVKDIAASRAFYEKLGFRKVNGDQAKNWLILQNDTATIGLFQGM